MESDTNAVRAITEGDLPAPLGRARDRMTSRLSIDKWLTRSAVTALLIATATVTWNVATAPKHRRGYQVGDTLSAVPGLEGLGPAFFVLWVDSRCGACVGNAGLYSRLTATSDTAPVIVMSPEPSEGLLRFVTEHGIRPARTISTNGEWLAFRGTPTILLVDESRVVRRVWYGQIVDSAAQEDLIRELTRVNNVKGD